MYQKGKDNVIFLATKMRHFLGMLPLAEIAESVLN